MQKNTVDKLCRAAVGVRADVTKRVSDSIPSPRTGDSVRGQKWAKRQPETRQRTRASRQHHSLIL